MTRFPGLRRPSLPTPVGQHNYDTFFCCDAILACELRMCRCALESRCRRSCTMRSICRSVRKGWDLMLLVVGRARQCPTSRWNIWSHLSLSCLALPYITLHYLTLSYLTLSYLILTYLLSSHLISSEWSYLMVKYLVSSHLISSHLIFSHLISSDIM